MDTRHLRWRVVLLALALLASSIPPASAERIASKPEDPAASRAADLARVGNALAREDVARALAAYGLDAGDVEARLAQLSDEDVNRLAANLDQVQAAGNVPNYIWILLAIFLAVSILAMVF